MDDFAGLILILIYVAIFSIIAVSSFFARLAYKKALEIEKRIDLMERTKQETGKTYQNPNF